MAHSKFVKEVLACRDFSKELEDKIAAEEKAWNAQLDSTIDKQRAKFKFRDEDAAIAYSIRTSILSGEKKMTPTMIKYESVQISNVSNIGYGQIPWNEVKRIAKYC